MSATTPSAAAYPPWTLRALRRMEDRLVEERRIEAICNSYVRTASTPANLARLRRELDTEVHRVRQAERVEEVPFYINVAAREHDPARLALDLSIPMFKHDCDACRFLGRVTFETFRGDETFDLYTCTKQGYRTFIYRFGDEGPAYSSCPESALPQGPHPALFECVRRARAEGF